MKSLSQKLAVVSLVVGGLLIFQGWKWGYNRNYTWKGNFEYTPRNTEEIPRPFEQIFENYVIDQWPFVLLGGSLFVAGGLLGAARSWMIKN